MSHTRVLALALFALSAAARADIAARPEVAAFIQAYAASRHADAEALTQLFRHVELQAKIIDAMDKPAEAKPWWQYRQMLLTEAQIQGGVEFWRQNRAAVAEAAQRHGVAPEIIVAIIGVESRYGQNLGNYRVIDALSTLAFAYPRRAAYFRKELEEYLLMCQEETIDPLLLRGSYAGAMGMPQFMPSSYRQSALDGDGDRKRNIWTNPPDAIASVAHYFAAAGWRNGEPAAWPAQLTPEAATRWRDKPPEISHTAAEWRGLGVNSDNIPAGLPTKLLALEGQNGPEYWLVAHNFSVILRYNHSPLYALAAVQLGQAILRRRGRGD